MTQVDPRFYSEILPRLWRGGSHGYYWSDNDGEGSKVTLWHALDGDPTPKVPSIWVRKLNCYFGIHPTKQRGESSWARAKIADIALINCLYAEVDGIDTPEAEENWLDWLLNDCALRPSLIIFSGGGLHVYWLLREPFVLDTPESLERAIILQKAIVAHIGGDTSVHDLARVLRIPGTINHKPTRNGAIVAIRHWEEDEEYDIDDAEARLAVYVDSVRQTRQEAHAAATQFESLGMDDQNVLRVMFGSRTNGEEYRQLWNGDMSCVNDNASNADQKLLSGLAWATGCDAVQMERMFRASALAPDAEREKKKRKNYVIDSITKAINTTHTVYDPNHGRDLEAIAAAEKAVVMQASGEQQPDPNAPPTPPPPNTNGSKPPPGPASPPPNPYATLWQIHNGDDALQPVKPLEYLIDGILPYPCLGIIYGGPGSLKSMILADIAVCVATGSRWLDVFPMDAARPGDTFATNRARVLWVDYDNGSRRTQNRLGAMQRGHHVNAGDMLNYVSMTMPHFDASSPLAIQSLATLIKSNDYKLIIIDNLGLITGDVEENNAAMSTVMGGLRRIVEECECAIILIHHQRKSATNGEQPGVRKGESLRGHSSIEAALDLALLVERKGREEKIAIIPTKVRDVLDFDIIGANFTYTSIPDTKDLQEARFYSAATKSKEQRAAEELEDTIIEEVRADQGIKQKELVDAVRDALAAKYGKAPGINTVRGTIIQLSKDGKLVQSGTKNALQYHLP